MNYADLLKQYIKNSRYKLDEISEFLQEKGLSATKEYLSRLQNGKTSPASDELNRAIAEITGGDPKELITAAYLEKAPEEAKGKIKIVPSVNEPPSIYDITNKSQNFIQQALNNMRKEDSKNDIEIDFVKIPILGEIKAGYNSIAEQNIIGYEATAKENVMDGQYFYLMVKGDSMIEEGIMEGCRVLVRHQGYVEDGKIGVVLVNGDEATLKRVFYQDNKVILQASNRKIPPRIVKVEDVRIQGQVVKVEFDV